MKVGLIHDGRCMAHDTGYGHPERAERMKALIGHFDDIGLTEKLVRLEFEAAGVEVMGRIHSPQYVERVRQSIETGKSHIDTPDVPVCAASWEVACLGVGGMIRACDAVTSGEVNRAFCAMRPPGHHAEYDKAMGFCLFNNVAIGADYLLEKDGINRVAIVDFDVHHGNGTQHAFERRKDVLFISLHEHPRFQYPGMGFEHETGEGKGEGYTLNVPLMPESNDATVKRVFEEKVLPALETYEPDVVMVSAGFDAATADPLGHLEFTREGYEYMTRELVGIANRFAKGRIISTLEGGYDLHALADCAAGHVETLLT